MLQGVKSSRAPLRGVRELVLLLAHIPLAVVWLMLRTRGLAGFSHRAV